MIEQGRDRPSASPLPRRAARSAPRASAEEIADRFMAFLDGPGGDVDAARACAEAVLRDLPQPPGRRAGARLLLTAACLHLYPAVGPAPTLADLQALLRALARPDPRAWRAMADSPLGVVRYAAAEYEGGRGRRARLALGVAMRAMAAKLARAF